MNPDSLIFKTAKEIKAAINDIVIICDLALDPYTTHGHDGIIDEKNNIDNDKTVQILAQGAVIAADSGYDLVAPSDMMDGRVKIIRNELEKKTSVMLALYLILQNFLLHIMVHLEKQLAQS